MIIVLIATPLAMLAGVAAWWIDQKLLRCCNVFRAIVAGVLTAVSIWCIAVIYGMWWLEFSMVTAVLWTWLPILFGLGLVLLTFGATFFSLFSPAEHNRWYRLIVPTGALTVFVFAYYIYSPLMHAFNSVMRNYTD